MYYRDKNGNKLDGKIYDKIVKENYSVDTKYSFLIYFASVVFCLILAFVLKDKLPDINITLLPFLSKDMEKIAVFAFIFGILLGLLINYIVYRS